MYTNGESVVEKTEAETDPRPSDSVDYRGNNWVTWLTVRMLQYTLVYRDCEGVLYTEEDRKADEKRLAEALEEKRAIEKSNEGAPFNDEYKYRGLSGASSILKRMKAKKNLPFHLKQISSERLDEIEDNFRFKNTNSAGMTLRLSVFLGVEPEHWIITKSPIVNLQQLQKVLDIKEIELRQYRKVKDFPAIYNAEKLGKLIGLHSAAIELLSAVVVAKTGAGLLSYMIADVERWEQGTSVIGMVKEVFELSDAEVAKLRDPKGKARIAGLPVIDWKATAGFAVSTDIMDSAVTEEWAAKILTTDQLVSKYFGLEDRPRLHIDNFAYMRDQVQLVVNYLREASRKNSPGTNVFLYGPPGTGKTQLARAVVKAAHLHLYTVRTMDEDRWAFSRYQTAQMLLEATKSDCAILMDEAEDFFNRAEFDQPKEHDSNTLTKYRLNATFEENKIPAIWIANSLYRIDPAHLRRFGIVIEVPVPPRRVRAEIFHKYTRGLRLSRTWIGDMAQNTAITPADIESAANVIKIAGVKKGKTAEAQMRLVLKEKLKVRGAHLGKKPKLETRYDLSLSNADVSLKPIVDGLVRAGEGRVMLYGPPGTGKTAFARHVAECVGKPLMAKKASDLLSMWVGENEKNIAEMFRRARLDDAVLLLDEADSFLQDRGDAHRSWEITMVNEMLVQMEHFQGIFLCSTNLMDRLDQATFRRFDIKVKFDWMLAEQKLRMMRQLTEELPSEMERHRLANLSKLTPGDFAAIARRFRVLQEPSPTPSRIIAELEEETRFKVGGSRKAGFRT